MIKRLGSLVCLLLLLSACASTDDKSEKDSSSSAPKELSSIEKSVNIKKLWRAPVGKGRSVYDVLLPPTLLDGKIFAADKKGKISAWNTEDGERLWRKNLDILPSSGLGSGDGKIAIGGIKGELVVLDAASGEELWRVALNAEILSAPAINDELVIAQTQDGKIYALSATDGKELWRYIADIPVLTLRGTATPLITARTVVSGFANGKIIALDQSAGGLLWEYKLGVPGGKTELERVVDVNSPVTHGGVVYATSYQGSSGAVSLGAGRSLWARKSSSFHQPAFAKRHLVVVEADGNILGLRASGGGKQWTNDDLLHRGLTAPTMIGSYVAVGDKEGYLHILSQEDGAIVGRVKVDGNGLSLPFFSEGNTLFVQDNDGDLTAYEIMPSL